MGYGVFVHRSDSIYNDVPTERYHFPVQYLRRVQATIGSWIVYYEPSKVRGSRGYFAAAKVGGVVADVEQAGMFFALIVPGSYLEFARKIPFREDEAYFEQGLLNAEGRLSGRAQSAVRALAPSDFARIVEAGLGHEPLLPRAERDDNPAGLEEEQAPFFVDEAQMRASQLVQRVIRDRVFRKIVLEAYDERCAITGLKLINGGGRAEVAAAHIRPVHANGPDTVSNGLALSGTAHWMFDRGLISLSDDLDILISRQANDPEGIRSIINKTGRGLSPAHPSQRPHPKFLAWHREHCFKS
ncbi:HNH endonuclease [Tianweitania populi]|uniref:HNH nuclease domain-containing protein n=1 Tax=Tianweitania populi TaxID=1607949 RepID=A0A8J3DYA3_9HYPH|nr:HNH endonuclease [Tianweitania populi]GHD18391.1 hypothetical protein GCM10016234_28900 [Tianweitania populi]